MNKKISILPEFHMGQWDGDIPRKDIPFYQGSSKLLSLILNNSLYILSFLIPLFVVLGCMIYHGFAPFGPNSMIIIDGTLTNLPILQQTNAALHEGNYVFYSLAGDGTMELLSTWAHFFMSPFTLITLLFDQKYTIALLSVFNTLRIAMAGPFMLLFLTHRPFGNKRSKYTASLLIFSIGYSLSSSMLFQYSDFMYVDHFMLFPLFLLGLEKLMAEEDSKLFRIITSICLFSQFNLGISMLLFALLYLLFRSEDSLQTLVSRLFRFLISSFFSICLSAITVIPGLSGLSGTISDKCPNAMFLFNPFDFILMQLFRHAPSFYTTSYSGSNAYCGLLVILLFILHFTDKSLSIRKRIHDILLLLIVFFAITQSQINYLFNIGHSSTSAFIPYAFFFSGLVLLYAYESLPQLRTQHLSFLIVALGLSIGLVILAMNLSKGKPDFTSVEQSLALFLCFGILLLLYRIGSIRRKMFYGLAISATVVELCMSAAFTLSFAAAEGEVCGEIVAKSVTPADTVSDGLSEIYKDIHGNQNYKYGLSSRYDTNPFITATTMSHLSNEIKLQYNPLSDSLAGLHTLYLTAGSNSDTLPNSSQYQKTGTTKDATYDLYENKYAFPAFYNVDASKSDYETMLKNSTTWAETQNAIAAFLGSDPSQPLFANAKLKTELSSKDNLSIKHLGHNIFNAVEPEETGAKDRYKINIELSPEESGDLYLHLDNPIHFGTVKDGEKVKYFYYINSSEAFKDHSFWLQGYIFHPEVLKNLSEKLNTQKESSITFHTFSFRISTDHETDRFLISILPSDNQLSIRLDGNEVSTYTIGDQMALFIPAGKHVIDFSIPVKPLIIGFLYIL